MEKQEWLNQRLIGSSDATIIMGCAPRNWEINTPYKLWQQRINQTQSEETHAMQKGKFFEEDATQWAEDHLGLLLERQKCVFHPENDFMSATLDAVSFDGRIVVEVKVSQQTYMQIESGLVPPTYYAQIQHQIEVQRCEKFYLVAYIPEKDGEEAMGACMEVERDDAYIADMVKKEKIFWDCLKTYTAPALTAWDYEEREDALWSQVAYELLLLDKELEGYEEIKKKRDEMKTYAIELANGRNSRGHGIKLTQSFPKGRVNYDAIPELKLVDLDKYRDPPSERWTLTKYSG